MAFIPEGSQFPPEEWKYWYDKYTEWKTWYSGDPNELLEFYSKSIIDTQIENNIFWARLEAEERANCVHMPAVNDICSMSADLLFSESAVYKYDIGTEGGEIIKTFMIENGFQNVLLEGAELSAALSGCVLKLDIDERLSKIPIVRTITPLNFFPTFISGRLWEILFFREVKVEQGGTVVYRLFENRKRNNNGDGFTIEFKLYKGTNDKIGEIINLNSLEETSHFKDSVINGVDGVGAVYIPNMRPNRLAPGSVLGINDFSGCIGLLESLDLEWTSLIRDIELGMGQLLVDEEMMMREETNIFGTQKTELNQFSKFQKCFLKLNLSNYSMGGQNVKPIESIQFEMRIEEHLKACQEIYKTIVNQCGYAASSFGFDTNGNPTSGRALKIQERKSFLTREKKSRYWQPAIQHMCTMIQQMYASINSKTFDIQDVTVELEDSLTVDSGELAETLKNLDQARSISTYMKIKRQYPDWNEEEIMTEVQRIQDEEGIEKNSDVFNLEA